MFYRPSHIDAADKTQLLQRFWSKDASLWSNDANVQESIMNRLGWLDCLERIKPNLTELIDFADKLRSINIERVIWLGMGGSSLCAQVLVDVFGVQKGYPELCVLDTTDPVVVQRYADELSKKKTFFVVASKSGTTLETRAHLAFFWQKVVDLHGQGNAGDFFAAITDSGTALETFASEHGFSHIFSGESGVGGRYSALSVFGLVAAAIIGIPLKQAVSIAEEVIAQCRVPDWDLNPASRLATFLSEYGVQNKDKLTMFFDAPVRSFGLWLEQLVAESTGKETVGLVPIIGETTGIPGFYGAERMFIYFRMKDTPVEDSLDSFVDELQRADFPVYLMQLQDRMDLFGMFFLWEMAVALTGHFLGINPFDEPNVLSAKQKTSEVLNGYVKKGSFDMEFWVDPTSQFNFRTSEMLAASMKGLSRAMRDTFLALPSWGYLGFLAYLPYDSEVDEIISEMRHFIRQERGFATTFGYGPRYLHSTGQVHKGGPMSSAFIIFTRQKEAEYPSVPGFDASFWHIQFAQAVGDFQALSDVGKRVIHIHLPADYRMGLRSFSKVFLRAARL
ncbi:MAG: phosphoheptose isomerase [Deltaproteobacteria bacterium]|jgi:glucose-6-phosphate isomerase/transaldolase/glucose-6-phosphate isomerase|nr:phosphoheptose isomerase [Deltaproteobacteria bacterium]